MTEKQPRPSARPPVIESRTFPPPIKFEGVGLTDKERAFFRNFEPIALHEVDAHVREYLVLKKIKFWFWFVVLYAINLQLYLSIGESAHMRAFQDLEWYLQFLLLICSLFLPWLWTSLLIDFEIPPKGFPGIDGLGAAPYFWRATRRIIREWPRRLLGTFRRGG